MTRHGGIAANIAELAGRMAVCEMECCVSATSLKAKTRNTLDQRALKLFVRHRLKPPARLLRALDPLAAEHAFFFNRGDRSADLAACHRS